MLGLTLIECPSIKTSPRKQLNAIRRRSSCRGTGMILTMLKEGRLPLAPMAWLFESKSTFEGGPPPDPLGPVLSQGHWCMYKYAFLANVHKIERVKPQRAVCSIIE